MPPERRRVPFPDRKVGAEFNRKFNELVGRLLRRVVDERIPPENQHKFYHGREWVQKRVDGGEMTGGVNAHTATAQLQFQHVIEGRISAIAEQARSIIEQMQGAFMQTLYTTVQEAVEEVGNVVDAKGKPITVAFLEMLESIEFGVDRRGEVSRPELHANPETAREIAQALEDAGPEFSAEVDRLMTLKETEALAREIERKARFKNRAEVE
jgi:hypothetical protein